LAVHYLGADVPLDQLVDAVDLIKPSIAVFSAQQLHTAATLLELAQTLTETGVPVAYGGRIFNLLPQIQKRLPGHYLGSDFVEAIETIEGLIRQAQPLAMSSVAQSEYDDTLRVFEQKRAAIAAEIFSQLPDGIMPLAVVQIASENLSKNISAALALGDMSLLGGEISWVSGMLQNRSLNGTNLQQFLQLYAQAAKHQLGSDGNAVNQWFEKVLK
jgi:hypothetical protein